MSFKNAAGKWLNKALFFELTGAHRPHACFTLKDADHTDPSGKVFLSLKRLFLESDDPTEYKFATEHLGSWAHWKDMQTQDDIALHIIEWREERDVRLQSLGIKVMVKMAASGENYHAAKYLADQGWITARGRPSKQEKAKLLRKESTLSKNVRNDMKRLRNG
jgi:hypothetical protein